MSNKIKFPKILIVSSNNLSDYSATNITLRSIFSFWPKSELLIVTTTQPKILFAETVVLDTKIFRNVREFFLKIIFKKNEIQADVNVVPGKILTSNENNTSLKSKIYTIGASYSDIIIRYKITNELLNKTKAFSPDYIYTDANNIKMIKLVNYLGDFLNVPILIHFMDDWPETRYTGNLFLLIPRLILRKSLKELLKKSKQSICISEKMCRIYEKRYKIQFFPLMNIVDSKILNYNQPVLKKDNNFISIQYFGGLHLNRWKTIKIIDELLNDSEFITYNIKLLIYTNNTNKVKYSGIYTNKVIFKDEVDHKMVIEEMKKSDYLLHIESFDDDILPFIRYSISTKIPEYLASKKPIIAIGPYNSASIEYLHKNGCAYVVTSYSKETIKELLLSFNDYKNEQFVNNALTLVKQNHTENNVFEFINWLK